MKDLKTDLNLPQREQLFGHPTGLFTLFFAELWERFSYYGMRALLVFYMIKGFMSYGDSDAYTIYGAYTSLVYMTPFFGGMIADRLIGARRAVILGGVLMASGHLAMTIEHKTGFFAALALLIVGNGFFKPNISTMVGSLYPQGSPKRDGGFTIFYIGINLGAAIAPLLCGYVGETYGWHKGFGLATAGMLTGLAVFIAPTVISQLLLLISVAAAALNILELEQLEQINPYLNWITTITMALAAIFAFVSLGKREQSGKMDIGVFSRILTQISVLLGAGGVAYAMFRFHPSDPITTWVFYIVAVVLVGAALVSVAAIGKAGLPAGAGMPPNYDTLNEKVFGITKEWMVYLGALLSVPIFLLFVSGFEPLFGAKGGISLIPESVVDNLNNADSAGMAILAMFVEKMSTPAGLILMLAGVVALVYLCGQIFRLSKVPRERMFVVMILTFFSMLFWSFFEQAGSSVNNFTDRNVDRVTGQTQLITAGDAGKSIELRIPVETSEEGLTDLPALTQEFLGYENDNPAMKEQLARAIRLVERAKIEQRTREGVYDPAVDAAKDELIAQVWAQVRPANNPVDNPSAEGTAETTAEAQEPEMTAEEKAAQKEAEKVWEDELKQRVQQAVAASNVIQPADDAARDLLVSQLVDRVKAEATVDSLVNLKPLTMSGLTYLRDYVSNTAINAPTADKKLTWTHSAQNAGLSVGGAEIPASVFQSVNAIFILIFGLLFTILWGWMNVRGIEPSTPVKFALGLIQLGLGFACFWYGAITCNDQGMVGVIWLILGYLFQTTGELCLSPVGLSMVTRLSPARLVSTVMGTWFLATAFSQFLAGIIAQFTGVTEGGDSSVVPVPLETVNVYGDVFRLIAIMAVASGVFCLLLSPILKKWMHEDIEGDGEDQ